MYLKQVAKRIKKRFRPIKWSRKILKKKKNQRRTIIGAGILIILGLSIFLVHSQRQQQELQTKVLHSQVVIAKTQNDIKELKSNVSQKQEEIEKSNRKIETKYKKQTKLEKKIERLARQNEELKSVYGGAGGVTLVDNSQYTSGNSYTPQNCTWGVKNWNPDVPNFWGNASEWDNNARNSGHLVNDEPEVGSVAQTDAGWVGHVALVIAVKGDSVTIKEMNGAGGLGSIDIRTVHKSEFIYIHV